MGSKEIFQPLSREDRITVILYRAGIVLSTVMVCALSFLLVPSTNPDTGVLPGLSAELLAYGLYASIALSVFFIHLYIGKLKVFLKNMYFLSLGCLIVLLIIGKGSPVSALAQNRHALLLLLPLSACLGFVTAKEAFCFRLFEGYLLAITMPVCLLLVSTGVLSARGGSYSLVLIAVMLVIFTLRKVFMPLAFDIGDKTAYQ